MRIVVVVEGGVVQGVYADREGVEVHVLDYDDKAAMDPQSGDAQYLDQLESAIAELREVW